MDQSDKILQAISKLENKLDDGFRMTIQRLDNIENVKLHDIEKLIKETKT